MNKTFNVNTDEVVKFTNKLEKLHKSAFPVAVRSTLNSAAFDVKQKTMPSQANVSFENRSKNFFKSNSRVEMAVGFDVKSMKSTVGFLSRGGTNKAVDELEQQESGGTIGGRSFIAVDSARIGKSHSKNVQKKNRISIMPNVVDARKAKGKNPRQKFIKSLIHAGVGGLVLSEHKGKEMLWRVNSLNRDSKGRFKLTAIYSFKKGRSVRVSATHFMEKSSLKSAQKLDDFFIIEAQKQIKRLTVK